MFTVEIEGLDALMRTAAQAENELRSDAAQAVNKAAAEGAIEARRGNWKDRTGDARRTITSRTSTITPTLAEAEIIAPLKYHIFLDEGTRPHEILPVRARYLRFVAKDGNLVFTKRVWHPGTKGFGFAGKAYHKAERVLWAEMEVAAEKFADKFK